MDLLRALLVLGFAGRLLADSGEPYEFVPDLRPEELAPTNAIDFVVPEVAAGPPGLRVVDDVEARNIGSPGAIEVA